MKHLINNLYSIEVPSDSIRHRIIGKVIHSKMVYRYLTPAYGYIRAYKNIPIAGEFKILGEVTKDEISFDVEPYVKEMNFSDKKSFKDYENNWLCFTDINESFRSLLQSKGIDLSNPKVKHIILTKE